MPGFTALEEEIEQTCREVRDCLDKMQRLRLMHLVDTQNLLQERISLASEEEQWARKAAEQEVTPHGKETG